MSYRRKSDSVGAWLLKCRPAIDIEAATEKEVEDFLSRLRQDIKDYYRPPETPTRITMIDPIEHHYGGLISHMMAAARMMRYAGPPLKMMEIDYSSMEARLMDRTMMETLETKEQVFNRLYSGMIHGDELKSFSYYDESHHIKPTKMGAGKNPFAETRITRYKK